MFSILPIFTGRERVFINSRGVLSFFLLIVLFALPIVFVIFYIFPEQVAKLEARYHLWRNHYEIKTYGYRFGDRDYIEMLQRHGISHVQIVGWEANESFKNYVTQYNCIMRDAIWRDLGVRLEK